MPYYLVDITELPYPHGMGTRGEESNCPFAISTLRTRLRMPNNWSPGPSGYRELFADKALLRVLTPILRPLFRWNHNWAIARAMEGLEPYARAHLSNPAR